MIPKFLGIRARGSASRPQRIPNAIPSMVLDDVGVEYQKGRAAFPSDIFVTMRDHSSTTLRNSLGLSEGLCVD